MSMSRAQRRIASGFGALTIVAGAVASVVVSSVSPASAAGAGITKGDLAVSLVSGYVDEYTPTGTFVQHLITPSEGLGLPTGSAFDGNGDLYVTDFSKNQILRRDGLTGAVTVAADNSTLGNGHAFDAPESIVFNRGYSRMYVSDANRDGPGGGINVVDTTTGAGVAYLPIPSSYGSEGAGEADWLAFDANSHLYMTNENPTQGVMQVDETTGDIVQPSFAPNLPNYGFAISFDKNGNLWVGDTKSIIEFNSQGGTLQTITNSSFSTIFAAVFNSSGDKFYAGDIDTGAIYTYDLSGNEVTSFSAGSGVSGLAVSGAFVPPNKPGLQNLKLHDVVLDNTDTSLASGTVGGREPSIAVNPTNPNDIAITAFSDFWNTNKTSNATIWYSQNGGSSWTRERTIPNPTNVQASGSPADQSIDYDRSGRLFGSMLVANGAGNSLYTGSTNNPTSAAAWTWGPGHPAPKTNIVSKAPDQPWLMVGPDPTNPSTDSVSVAYQDDSGNTMRATTLGDQAAPQPVRDAKVADLQILPRVHTPNPGLRLAVNKVTGTRYALWESVKSTKEPVDTTYYVSRSKDGGKTWDTPTVVANVKSAYGFGFSFGGVNELDGGIDSLAVDPTNGDVLVAYAEDTDGEGVSNGLELRRVHWTNSGVSVGPAARVSDSLQLALPSVAIANDGTVAVLYDGYAYRSAVNRQQFRAAVAVSTNGGSTFSDNTLAWFDSPCSATDRPCLRKVGNRVWGDFQQMKAQGNTFYGVFAGNRKAFKSDAPSITDPVFFSFDS